MNTDHLATLRIQFPGNRDADHALQALEPDNNGHMEALVESNELVLTAHADSIMGLLRTIDDAMGCLRAMGTE
jgi:hypothetical protein